MLNKSYQYYQKILFKGVFALFLLLGLSLLPALNTKAADATAPANDARGDALNILDQTGFQANLGNSQSPTTFQIIGSVINLILGFVGILFFGLVVYGGVTWLMAGGTPEQVDKAINILKRSAFGIVVVVLAFILTNFVVFRVINIFIK